MLDISWKTLLLGDTEWMFLVSVCIRTIVMFIVIVAGLRLLGKRGIKQLSVVELGVIVGLGSAAGDPMFYKEVGLISCVIVFVVVILLYHLLEFVVDRSESLEKWVEGKPVVVIADGRILFGALEKETLSVQELFSQLRINGIFQLGQVKTAILEPTGEVSVFPYSREATKPGLPVLPGLFDEKKNFVESAGLFACCRCGRVAMQEVGEVPACPDCGDTLRVAAMDGSELG